MRVLFCKLCIVFFYSESLASMLRGVGRSWSAELYKLVDFFLCYFSTLRALIDLGVCRDRNRGAFRPQHLPQHLHLDNELLPFSFLAKELDAKVKMLSTSFILNDKSKGQVFDNSM